MFDLHLYRPLLISWRPLMPSLPSSCDNYYLAFGDTLSPSYFHRDDQFSFACYSMRFGSLSTWLCCCCCHHNLGCTIDNWNIIVYYHIPPFWIFSLPFIPSSTNGSECVFSLPLFLRAPPLRVCIYVDPARIGCFMLCTLFPSCSIFSFLLSTTSLFNHSILCFIPFLVRSFFCVLAIDNDSRSSVRLWEEKKKRQISFPPKSQANVSFFFFFTERLFCGFNHLAKCLFKHPDLDVSMFLCRTLITFYRFSSTSHYHSPITDVFIYCFI